MGVGRVGGMVSPLPIGVLLTLGTVGWVWLLLGSVELAVVLVSLWLVYETRGRNLGLVFASDTGAISDEAQLLGREQANQTAV